MMLINELQDIIKRQKEALIALDFGIEREVLKKIDIKAPLAIIISGVRRAGKSTLLRQIASKIKDFNYLSFDDIRLVNFEPNDFNKLLDLFEDKEYCFFDEIQNIPKWEVFIRTLLDNKKKVIITGSNASLLSKELGTRLTGRHLTYEVFPFSFNEFLKLNKMTAGKTSFNDYLSKGGFPEYIKNPKDEILQELLTDVITKDIAVRYKIRDFKSLKEIALYLLTNAGKTYSYNQLAKTFSLGSANTAINFVSYFEECYLLFSMPKFDYSLKKQSVNPKKIYSIDNGLARINSLSFSNDKGRMLENAVFINLRRKFKEVYYHAGKKECDFLIKERNKITLAAQACYELNNDNKEREIEGLLEAMNEFKLKKGLIITYDQEDEIKKDNKLITITPAWKWLLQY